MRLFVRYGRTLLIAAAGVAVMVASAAGGDGGNSCPAGREEGRNARGGGAAYAVAAYDFSLSCGNRPCDTVRIGNQVWMAENLNYTPSKGKYWCYENDGYYCDKYGRLYDWHTAMGGAASSNKNPSGVRGVCPTGWHVPSRAEWNILIAAAGGQSKMLKSTTGWPDVTINIRRSSGSSEWAAISSNGTDDYGFSALPDDNAYSGSWWTATGCDVYYAYKRIIYSGQGGQSGVPEYLPSKDHGTPVRCVKD